MDDSRLRQAKQKQDAYLFSWGHLEDVPAGDENFNDFTREIIAAYKESKGTAYLGKLVFSWNQQKKLETGEGSIYTEYSGQWIPAYGCNFVVPVPDSRLEEMVTHWAVDEWPPKFDLFVRITRRIEELQGLIVNWR